MPPVNLEAKKLRRRDRRAESREGSKCFVNC